MTCPLSLGAIILLTLVIFYSTNNLIIFFAAFVLLNILFNFGKLEKFVAFSSDLAENPNNTGIGRSMFGPLYPITPKAEREQNYRTMHGLPWCESPLGETQDGDVLCNQRTGLKPIPVPYEMDKI